MLREDLSEAHRLRLVRVAERVREARRLLEADMLSRDRVIFDVFHASGGRGLRAIARAADLAASHVERIIDQQTAAAHAAADQEQT